MDEAHCARKHNQIHRAYRGVRERCLALVAMTATPVTTKTQVSHYFVDEVPFDRFCYTQDLFVMGQWMGIPGFEDFKEYLLLNKEINRAHRQDTKALREAGIEANIVRGVFIGVRNPNTPDLESPKVTTGWMNKIRERFAHYVIRRTIDSIDYAGNKLFGMRPYTEHVLKLQMYDWESGNLRRFAKDLVKENPVASADTRKVSENSFFGRGDMAVSDGRLGRISCDPQTHWQVMSMLCHKVYIGAAVLDGQVLDSSLSNMLTSFCVRTFI